MEEVPDGSLRNVAELPRDCGRFIASKDDNDCELLSLRRALECLSGGGAAEWGTTPPFCSSLVTRFSSKRRCPGGIWCRLTALPGLVWASRWVGVARCTCNDDSCRRRNRTPGRECMYMSACKCAGAEGGEGGSDGFRCARAGGRVLACQNDGQFDDCIGVPRRPARLLFRATNLHNCTCRCQRVQQGGDRHPLSTDVVGPSPYSLRRSLQQPILRLYGGPS